MTQEKKEGAVLAFLCPMSNLEFAARLSVEPDTLFQWYRGTKKIDPEHLDHALDLCGVDLDHFDFLVDLRGRMSV